MSSPKYHAKSIRKELGISALPINPYKIAEQLGIEVLEDKCEGYTGMLLVVDNHALISVKETIREYPKKRFTVAHELGHYNIPGHIRKDNLVFKCTDKDLNTFGNNNNKESEANAFAAELLMPESSFKQRIKFKDLSYDLIQDLMTTFETSLTATAIRFVELSRNYALICSRNSSIKWFFKGAEFPFYIQAEGKLSEDSIAFEFFKGRELSKSFQSVPADVWIDDYRLRDDMEIQEMSIAIPYYNQVLTFIYVENYEENDEDEYLEELNGYPKFKK